MNETNDKPIIFLAFANDRDDSIRYLRNLPNEARQVRNALQRAEDAGLCELVVRSNASTTDIFNVFQDARFRDRIAIFHFGGHANSYQLLFESNTGQAMSADAVGLAEFIREQHALHLVFLNGCSTKHQTQALLDANVTAVISTSRAINDQVATDFSCRFYQALGGGACIRTAFNEAEASIRMAVGADIRALYVGDATDSFNLLDADSPWNLYLREGAESADRWNLPAAVNDPLFAVPKPVERDLPELPYRHLNRFTSRDAEIFFGRGHQIRELYTRLTAGTHPIVMFYGQSGVGKSSILEAGIIPRLENCDCHVRHLRRTEAGLLDTLQMALLPESAEAPIEEVWQVKERRLGKPLIVFLDQVEEVYTRPIPGLENELDQLLQVVKGTFGDLDKRPQGKMVLCFREEWLAKLETRLMDYQLPRTKVLLDRLDRSGIIEVVQGPARSERLRERYGLDVEDGLAEIIADDLLADRGSAIAPTLQILLTKMWTQATQENHQHPRFSQDLYNHLKRKGILLRDFLDQQLASFSDRYPEAVDSGLLLDIVALHTTPLGTADQCNVEDLKQQYVHLGATLPDLLRQCQDLHLLTVAASAAKASTTITRLSHDTLAPLVRERFDESDKPGQRARRILDNRVTDWKHGKVGTPLDDADLAVVEKGASGTRALNPTEQRLLEASRREREKRRRLQVTLRVGGSLGAVVIVALAVWALIARNQSQIEAAESTLIWDFFVHHLRTNRVTQFGQEYPDPGDAVRNLELRDDLRRAEIFDQLGDAFVRLGDLQTGNTMLQESLLSLKRCPESERKTKVMARTQSDLGFLRSVQGRFDRALELFDQTLENAKKLGLGEDDELVITATILRCNALRNSSRMWDNIERNKLLTEISQTSLRLERANQEKALLVVSLQIIRAFDMFDRANAETFPTQGFLRIFGDRLMEHARRRFKRSRFQEPAGEESDRGAMSTMGRAGTPLLFDLYDEFRDYSVQQLYFWRSGRQKREDAREFVENTYELRRKLAQVYGDWNPMYLEIPLIMAQTVTDEKEKERLLLGVLEASRKQLGTEPAFAKYAYFYARHMERKADALQGRRDRAAMYEQVERLLNEIVVLLDEALTRKQSRWRVGLARLRLGEYLKRRGKEREARQQFKLAWKIFEGTAEETYSRLGARCQTHLAEWESL